VYASLQRLKVLDGSPHLERVEIMVTRSTRPVPISICCSNTPRHHESESLR
jgi:hypothetical protein